MTLTHHDQFFFPEKSLTALPTIHVQHARAVAKPTASVTMPFDFKTVNKNIPTTFDTYLKPTPTGSKVYQPFVSVSADTAVHPTTTDMDPAWPRITSSSAAPSTTPTYTDLTTTNERHQLIDGRKAWIIVGALGVLAVLITVVAVLLNCSPSRRRQRKASTRPTELIGSSLPSYAYPRENSSKGLNETWRRSGDPGATLWTGGSSRGYSGRDHRGGNGSYELPSCPEVAYSMGRVSGLGLGGERKFFGGV